LLGVTSERPRGARAKGWAMSEERITWGPCCFCGKDIAPTEIDPCNVQVTTQMDRWQMWFCHALCFKQRLAHMPPDGPDLEPAIF